MTMTITETMALTLPMIRMITIIYILSIIVAEWTQKFSVIVSACCAS